MSDPVRHLYIHIPFCPTKCHYCAFVTHVGSTRLIEPYVAAVTTEIERLGLSGRTDPLDTVYLGGGTPSMLDGVQLARLLDAVRRELGMVDGAEISMESHPSTIDEARLAAYREAGVTRISFGAESLNEGELRAIGRSHDPETALRVVAQARAAGFESANLDLMYGLPGQSPASWESSLSTLIDAAPQHISLYPLSIEPRTVFARRVREGALSLPEDETVVEMYLTACKRLRAAGYEHYEIANWAKPGHACRHNLAYWHDREYFGVGVGAHAYLRPFRTENIRGVKRYIEMLAAGGSPVVERERVGREGEISESVVLRLRLLLEGLSLAEVERDYGPTVRAHIEETAAPLIAANLMRRRGDRLFLEETAVPVANEIWDRFIVLEPLAAPAL